MPRNYVDNAMNRRLGRVGMPVGSAVHSRSSGFSGMSSWSGTSASFMNYGQSTRTYVDNAYNRQHDRVGLELGSKVIPASTMPRSYVDNAMNRRLGRVGMPVGSAVHSRSSGFSGMSSSSGTSASFMNYDQSTRTYVDNAYNRQHDRVGLELGSKVIPASTSKYQSTRTYVDNAYNRQHDRVGLEVGSKVIPASTSKDQSTRTYVDNAYNRQHDRVGLEVGSKVIPASTSKDQSARNYRDNAYNRKHDRVGLEVGSKVIPASTSKDQSTRTYVDNAINRKHDRVGLEVGSKPLSASTSKDQSTKAHGSRDDGGLKRYADTSFNRRHNRVGKIVGTSIGSSGEIKVYADNPLNRKLNRVGKPRGSCPQPNKSRETKKAKKDIDDFRNRLMFCKDLIDDGRNYDDYLPDWGYEPDNYGDDGRNYDDYLQDLVYKPDNYGYNRELEESEWADKEYPPRTRPAELNDFKGNVIPFEELEMGRKIGMGGFGEVFFAKWSGTVVAVKKLLLQKLSKRRIKEFTEEIEHCSKFDHPNIVKYFGACVEMPNLAIVMEYLDMSLFDALHIRTDMDLTEANRLIIVQYTIEGTKYLHDKGMAHCDLKTANVLMNYEVEKVIAAKLADFGLSVVIDNTQTSVSGAHGKMHHGGTPRYSAPEVLRGEILSATDMMKADVYSIGLIIFEILYEEEPFYNLTYPQLQKQVGENNLQPTIPREPSVNGDVINMMKKSWSSKATHRPSIDAYRKVFSTKQNMYSPL